MEHGFSSRLQWKIFGSKGTYEKVVPFHRRKCSHRKFVFHILKIIVIIFDTSSKLSRPFFGSQSWIFSCHLSKPWTDRFANVKGEQTMSLFYVLKKTISCTMIDQEIRVHYDNQLPMFKMPSAQWYTHSSNPCLLSSSVHCWVKKAILSSRYWYESRNKGY